MLRKIVWSSFVVCVFVLGVSTFNSCTKDKTLTNNTTLCDSVAVTYTNQIEPVLAAKCVVCHGGFSPKLESYEQVVDAAKNGNLYCSINWTGGCKKMPDGSPQLPDSTLKVFDTWKCKNYPK